jgi:hypothetical protein
LGKWGYGWLNPISKNEFLLDIQSDYLHVHYSGGHPDPPNIRVVYEPPSASNANARITYITNEHDEELVTVFEKYQFLIDLPEQPWSEDSCGPAEPEQ